MKKRKSIIAGILSLALTLSCVVPAAAETSGTTRIPSGPVNISGMNVNPYVVQNGDINYLNGKTIVQYNGSAFQIGAVPNLDSTILPEDGIRITVTGSNVKKTLKKNSYTELVDIKAGYHYGFMDPDMASYWGATLMSVENFQKRIGTKENVYKMMSWFLRDLEENYTVEELRNYSSAKEFIEQTGFWQDTSQKIAGYTYKQIVDAWLAEMETWQGHWDYFLYGDEHFKYFYGNTQIHKPGYGAGNTFQGFSYVVDQINVTHEPQYEYTVTKPGTVTITVEGTQRQDGYGIANLVGKKTVQIQVKAKTSSGWRMRYGSWYYYNDYNEMQTGWQYIDNKWYYLTQYGPMAIDWWLIGGKWYFFHTNGVMATGWNKLDGKWYYMNGSGAMQTGWQKIGGKWYYMNGSGAMVTGWQKIGGKWYYMNKSGAMLTGWQKISGKWYYMNGSGAMVTGWQKIGGKWYYMNGSGVMLTGKQKINGKWYQFNGSGVWIK